jgi:hypothetical protein
MAVAKKATKKTTKKVVKKAVAKKTAAPKKAATPVIVKPDLNLARRQLAHDYVNRINLRVGDEFQVLWVGDFKTDNLIGQQCDDWRNKEDEYVIFKGINHEGSLICADIDDEDLTYELPAESVNVDEIDRNGGNGSVRLNREYTADLSNVRHGRIEVGCQSIEVSVVLALADRIKEIQAGATRKNSRDVTLVADGTYAELAFK